MAKEEEMDDLDGNKLEQNPESNEIAGAYRELEEKYKKKIFKAVAKHSPKLFKAIQRFAGLMTGGIRPTTIIERTPPFGQKVDAYLLSDSGKDELASLVSIYILDCREDLRRKCDDAIPSELPSNEELELFRQELKKGEEPFADLFIAVVKDNSVSRMRTNLPPSLSGLGGGLNILGKCSKLVKAAAEKIELAKPLDYDAAVKALRDAENTTKQVRESLDTAAASAGVTIKDWSDKEELYKVIEEIVNKSGGKKTEGESIRSFISNLADLIAGMEIIHKSLKRAQSVMMLRDGTVAQLREGAKAEFPNPIPASSAHVVPREWLEWSLGLAGEDLEKHQTEIAGAGYSLLSEFIEEADYNWLPSIQPQEEPSDAKEPGSIPETEEVKGGSKGQTHGAQIRDEETSVIAPLTESEIPGDKEKEERSEPEPKENLASEAEAAAKPSTATDEVIRLFGPGVLKENIEKHFRLDSPLSAHLLGLAAWQQFYDKRHSLAYQLSKNANLGPSDSEVLPSPWALEMAIIAESITYLHTSLVGHMQLLIGEYSESALFNDKEPVRTMANRLILSGAGLRAALMAPDSGADQVLKDLHLGAIPSLRSLIQEVVQFSQRRQIIVPEFLRESLTQEEWARKKADVIDRIKSWWEKAVHYQTNFAPATKIWQHWLKPGQTVYELIRPLINGSVDTTRVASFLKGLDLDKSIDHANQVGIRRPQPIEGRARKMLLRMGEEAIGLAREWMSVMNSRMEHAQYAREPIGNLIRAFDLHAENATREIEDLAQSNPNLPLLSSAKYAMDSIKDLRSFLKGKALVEETELSPEKLLSRDLLLLGSVHLDMGWMPDVTSSELTYKIIEFLGSQDFSVERAFQRHCLSGDHLSAERLLAKAEEDDFENRTIETLKRQLGDSRKRHIECLTAEIDDVRTRLSDGLAKGLIGQTEYADASDQVELLAHILSDEDQSREFRDFYSASLTINRIRQKLTADRDSQTNKIRAELDGLEFGEKDKARIKAILDSGDIHLALDFIERLKNGQSLDEISEGHVSHFPVFFGLKTKSRVYEGHFNSLAEWLKKNQLLEPQFHDLIQRRQPIAGLDLASIPSSQSRQYAETIRSWFSLKKLKRIEGNEDIQTILRGLGLNLLKPPNIRLSGGRIWMRIECSPIITPPVAHYGSQANGKYKILLNFAAVSEEEVFSSFEKQSIDRAGEIVFYFGRLSETQRRNFAQLCVRNKRTIILIDDTVMLYLASVKGRKFDALLACAMPFTYFMPYVGMSSGLLPSEMFFGRSSEIRAIELMSAEGSSLLYGGRQIGKTFLLKEAQKRVHHQAKGQIAIFLDLKHHGFGLSRRLEALWSLLAAEISGCVDDCFPETIRPNASFDWFKEHIQTWLSANANRRVLLLLDEADVFLEADAGNSFSICDQLRGLMEVTHLRFKAVFAGLHNVQRSTRVANNPLAHLGRPLCVGPLLGPVEAREAQALIEMPLAAAGIFFDTHDLAVLVLAQANYYPNLIQIYGLNLVNHVLERQSLPGPRDTPPYILTSEDIKDVYERQALRDELWNKFRLTLDLDRRFRLIANLLALYYEDYPKGYSTNWIFTNSLEWWPKGFRESGSDAASSRAIPFDAFCSLLDEMVGLGILRKLGTDLYNLRSPNVVSLLGTKAQIERVLEDFAVLDAPAAYSPDTFRALIDETDKARRSPLSATQENVLRQNDNRALIIAGSLAAGLDDIYDAIVAHSLGREYVLKPDNGLGERSFQKFLSQLTHRKGLGKTFLIIPQDSPLNLDWIRETQARLGKYTRQDAYTDVLFLADPESLWESAPLLLKEEKGTLPEILTLHPWKDDTVRIWIEDAQLALENPKLRNQIFEITGYWPILLNEIAKKASSRTIDGAFLDHVRGDISIDASRLYSIFFSELDKNSKPLIFLRALAELNEPSNEEDVLTWIGLNHEGWDNETVRLAAWWADKLDFIRVHERGWALDPFVMKFLTATV